MRVLRDLVFGQRLDHLVVHQQPVDVEQLLARGIRRLELDGAALLRIFHRREQPRLEQLASCFSFFIARGFYPLGGRKVRPLERPSELGLLQIDENDRDSRRGKLGELTIERNDGDGNLRAANRVPVAHGVAPFLEELLRGSKPIQTRLVHEDTPCVIF